MINELKYQNGELLTNQGNCFELSFTIDQIVEYRDYDIHILYFYSYDYDYNIHYDIETGKIYIIYNGDNEKLENAIDEYWNDGMVRNLQIKLDTTINYDENIRDILSLMDDFTITIKESENK
jgi:predicted heme/steroid binding protein